MIATLLNWITSGLPELEAGLLRASVHGGLSLVAAWGICRLFPRLSPAVRCWIWRLAYLRLVAALFWTTPVELPLLRPAVVAATPIEVVGTGTLKAGHWLLFGGTGTAPPPVAAGSHSSIPVSGLFLVGVWIVGVLWCLSRIFRDLRQARRLRHEGRPVHDPEILAMCESLCRELGVRRSPQLLHSEAIRSPVLLGALRPVIALPVDLLEQTRPGALRSLLAHELAHLKRGDLWWNWLPALVHVLFYFHPVVWLANREWQVAQEVTCDEIALTASRVPAAEYGEMLLRMVRGGGSRPCAAASVSIADSAETIKRRLKEMKQMRTGRAAIPRRAALLLGVGAVLTLVPWRVVAAGDDLIAYVRMIGERTEVRVMNADGTGDRALPNQTAALSLFPTWSPDGKRIAYTRGQRDTGTQVVIVNADGTGETQVSLGMTHTATPAWSPDGKLLAVTAINGDVPMTVYVCDVNGGNQRRINPEGTNGLYPFWLSDGKTVGYTRVEPGKLTLMLGKAEGGDVVELTQAEGIVLAGSNSVSPDGKRLAYVTAPRGQDPPTGRLHVIDLKSRDDTMVCEVKLGRVLEPFGGPWPSWTPDGKSILLSLEDPAGHALHQISLDGKTQKRLSPEGIDCLHGAWKPVR